MLGIRQKIAIGGGRIDASQHRRGTLEYFVMRANTNCKVILGTIDGARLPGRGLEPVMDRADADGDVEQIAQQLSYVSVRTVADQDQGQRQLAQPPFGHPSVTGRWKSVSSSLAASASSSASTAFRFCR